MSQCILTIRRDALNHLDHGVLTPMTIEQLDRFLARFAAAHDKNALSPDLIQVAVFAVVLHKGAVLRIQREGDENRLGFGLPVTVDQHAAGQSFKMHIIDALHRELEQYIPGAEYAGRFEGIIYSPRDPDRQNLGVLFTADTAHQVEAQTIETLSGTKLLQMIDLQDIDPAGVTRWSSIVLQYCLECYVEASRV